MATDGFAQRRSSDRGFHAGFVAAGWVAIWFGFADSVRQRLAGHADYPAPPILLAHILVFTAWMLLLTIQVALVAGGRTALHRRLGMCAVVLLPLLLVTGIGAEVYSQRFYTPKSPENANFFIAPLVEMAIFAVCAALAVANRQAPAVHKRLMLVATAMLLSAAFNRWWGGAIYAAMGDGFWGMATRTFLGPDLLIVAAMLHDWFSRGRVHRVFIIAAPSIILVELAASAIYHLPAWAGLVRLMVGV